MISDIPGDEDESPAMRMKLEEEEEVASEIIDGLLDGLERKKLICR